MKSNLSVVVGIAIAITTLFSGACRNPGEPSGTNSVTISVAPGSVKADGIETAVLSWFTRGGSCVASGDWNGSQDSGGSKVVGPFSTDSVKTYGLTCDGVVANPAVLFVGAGSGGADTQTSSDGHVTVTIVQRTPATGPLVAGQPQKLKVHVVNRSDDSVFVSFDIFGGGSTFEAHSESDWTGGSSSGSFSGSIPFVHLSGFYSSKIKTEAWVMEFAGWP
jgi:hypothetical protein